MAKGFKTGGRVKGRKNEATIDREWERELMRRQILAHSGPLTDAQIKNAMGIGHLMLRDNETGKFERVVTTGDPAQDEARIDAAVSTGSACWIYLKDPSIQAYTTLMAYAVDKPKEQPQTLEVKGTVNIVDTLRQRYAKRKKAE